MSRAAALRICAIFACLMLCAGAASAEAARIRAATKLLSRPATSASTVTALKAGAAADIFERKGFWAHVRSGGKTGWLKLSSLSLGSGGSASQVAALASGRTGSKNVVSASGGRGLDAADLARAKPDNAAVAGLARQAVSEAAAEKFARAGKLKTRRIAYLRASASQRVRP